MTPKRHILVVEDNWINREMLKEILEGQYQVLEAENGQEALNILRQRKDDVALVLLDVMMPVMDGYTFLHLVKSDPELALIPVIVMTQSDSDDDEVSALSHGATDFVPKPYRPQVILHRVASIINLRETAAMVNQFQFDRLTGLYSKEFFYQKVRERLQANPQGSYTIVCSNIENFKLFNDSFGTEAGNKLLREMADTFRTLVGEAGICGRFGADRFLCLRNRPWDQESRGLLELGVSKDPNSFMKHINVKWGVYEITDPSVPVEQMCDRAFLAVNSIKGQYNRPFAVYDDTLRNKLLREQAITDVMETALQEGQFVPYFQPKYNLADDSLAGSEALVRWIHPEWGFMSPGDFIPLFEKNGFITRLDNYIWEQVCMLLRDWRLKGYPSLPVSVNVSRADIYQEDLPQTLLHLVQKYELDPALLHLEITESAYTENPNQIISTVDELRKLGFIIEMDDFGSGYSSLNMLSRLHLDILKLDMKFIQNETSKPSDQGILRFVLELARWINLRVVAEGVESLEQLERLRQVGCDYAQGFFLAKPMPDRAFAELLSAQPIRQANALLKEPRNFHGIKSVLVADENAAYRAAVRATFENQYQVLEAANAQEALAHIANHRQNSVSVVILSMSLPEHGTAQVMKAMRQDPTLWHIPILSTIAPSEVTEEVAMEVESDDFLCKRHPMSDLRKRVRHLMQLSSFRERAQTLEHEACWDELTGLLNRKGLSISLDTIQREDLPLAVYFFDLDGLNTVNETHGHGAGDELLRYFAQIIHRQTRQGDVLCRYGGDEFVLILRHIISVEVILRKGEEISRSFRDYLLPGGIHPSCSCGITLCGVEERPSEDMLRRAELALQQAKENHRGGCCLWESLENS